MADTAVADLTTIAGADTATDDTFVVGDTSAGITKSLTRTELANALAAAGVTTIAGSEPTDGSLTGGMGAMWVDSTVSPWTLNLKYKNTASPEVVTTFVIG